jgi:DNA-binding MarR family transcriptional regulator
VVGTQSGHGRSRRSRTVAWSPDEPWAFLREAYHVLRRQRAALLQDFGLSLSEYSALQVCARAPAMPSEIAERAGVTSAGATDIIDRLEKRQLVKRLSHPRDRRAVLVALTSTGRRLHVAAQSAQRDVLREVGRSMTEAERKALVRGLAAFVRSLPPPV